MPTTARHLLILHNQTDADDAAQDVTLDRLAGIRSEGMEIITTDIAGLVRTMVIHRALNVARVVDRRHARRGRLRSDEADVHAWMTSEAPAEDAELEARIEVAVASHLPMCRRLLHTVREDDPSCAALPLTPGITRYAVNEHLATARRRLRAALMDAGVIALPDLRARPTDVLAGANELPVRRPDPAADPQDLAA